LSHDEIKEIINLVRHENMQPSVEEKVNLCLKMLVVEASKVAAKTF